MDKKVLQGHIRPPLLLLLLLLLRPPPPPPACLATWAKLICVSIDSMVAKKNKHITTWTTGNRASLPAGERAPIIGKSLRSGSSVKLLLWYGWMNGRTVPWTVTTGYAWLSNDLKKLQAQTFYASGRESAVVTEWREHGKEKVPTLWSQMQCESVQA